jgi:hypothetical protein
MRFQSSKLPKVQRFPCTIKDVRSTFGNDELNLVGFAWPYKQFAFDSRSNDRPTIRGIAIAQISVSRELVANLYIYPLLCNDYNDAAESEFVNSILPRLRNWIIKQLSKQETQILGHETMIVEWFEKQHFIHEMRYL